MLFKSKKDCGERRRRIEKVSQEIAKIWSPEGKAVNTDVTGSYTGNPEDLSTPVQDADDL